MFCILRLFGVRRVFDDSKLQAHYQVTRSGIRYKGFDYETTLKFLQFRSEGYLKQDLIFRYYHLHKLHG